MVWRWPYMTSYGNNLTNHVIIILINRIHCQSEIILNAVNNSWYFKSSEYLIC